MEVWTVPLKKQAGEDDCLKIGIRSRGVALMIGGNWEAAPSSLDIDKQGKD